MDLEQYILENRDKSIRQISKELGVNRNKISDIFKKLNINKDVRISDENKKVLLKNKHLTSTELHQLTGIPKSTIRSFFKRNGIDKSILKLDIYSEEIINLYNNGKSSRYIAEKFNVSHSGVLKFLKKQNIDTTTKKLLSDVQYQYVIDNYNFMTSTMLANELGVSTSLICSIWRQNDLVGKTRRIFSFKNEQYFSVIDTYQKAYFLGLIASDGCLYKRDDTSSQGILKITLHKKDACILELFKKELLLDKPLHFYNNYVSLEVVSDIIFNDLEQYGLTTKKTWNLNLKCIPNEFLKGFILGYFDGDGSIYWSDNRISNNRISRCGVSIVGTESSILTISVFLNKLKLGYKIIKDNRKDKYNGNFYNLVFVNTTQKYCFLKLIYSCNIDCLDRKKEKASKFLYAVENNLTNRKENIS